MRWADLDQLNHVNNVVYVEYAAEAQALLRAADELPDSDPRSVQITFLSPMLLSLTPVTVRTTLDGGELTQEVCSGDTVNARVVSSYREPAAAVVVAGADGPIPVRTRIGDVDGTGAVTVPKLCELYQESRVLLISQHLPKRALGQFVVGTVTIDVLGPMPWRPEAYEAHGWLTRVGDASFTIEMVITDGDRVLSRGTSVLVGFDLEAQTSRRFTEEERAAMLPHVLA